MSTLPVYDFTTFNAIATCPTWGLVTYIRKKTLHSTDVKAAPLEAGKAFHEVAAAQRYYWLWHVQGLEDHVRHHAPHTFGANRFEYMMHENGLNESTSYDNMLRFCLSALETYGYIDDPYNKRLAYQNVEDASVAYLNARWSGVDKCKDIWVSDENDPTAPIGIEIPLHSEENVLGLRFILAGRADGVHVNKRGELVLEDNKTSGRINDTWSDSIIMSHQMTIYRYLLGKMIGIEVQHAHGLGTQIPIDPYGSSQIHVAHCLVDESRTQAMFDWMEHLVEFIQQYEGKWEHNAPQYTHSCNRYFRSCSLIPYCAESATRRAALLDEMEDAHWNPLESAPNVDLLK